MVKKYPSLIAFYCNHCTCIRQNNKMDANEFFMKLIFRILFCTLFIFLINIKAQAQNIKKDTVYYLLDTLKTPVNDRIWNVEIESRSKFYIILCRCLKYNCYPTFIRNVNVAAGTLSKSDVNKIKFISLVKLIDLAGKDGGDSFNNYHVIYFVEPSRGEYSKSQVRLMRPVRQDPIIDYEVLKNDSAKVNIFTAFESPPN